MFFEFLLVCVVAVHTFIKYWFKKRNNFPDQWHKLRTKLSWSYTEDGNGDTPPAYEGRSTFIVLQPEANYTLSGRTYDGVHNTFNNKLNNHEYGIMLSVGCMNPCDQLRIGGSVMLMRDFDSKQLKELLAPLGGKSGQISFKAENACIPVGQASYTVTLDIETRHHGDQYIRGVNVTTTAQSYSNWIKWYNCF